MELAGAIVAKIAPKPGADPVAILTQLPVASGALIGRGAHFQIDLKAKRERINGMELD